MKIQYFILLLLLQTTLFAQKNVYLQANIIDSTYNDYIPFATIAFSKSKAATTSDIDGNFRLAVSTSALPDTIIIRHLSYGTHKLWVTKENIKTTKSIFLKSINIEICVTVLRSTPKNIIEKCINNLDNNYYSNLYYLKGFYRQTHQENNKFVRLIESFVDIEGNIRQRSSDQQKEKFYIEKIRRSNIYERNGDKHGDHLADLFSENPINNTQISFLNLKNFFNYKFTFEESNNINHYRIVFQNKEWTSHENKHGYIVINKEDYAIVEFKIVSTNNRSKKEESKSNWKFQNGTYHVFYQKKGSKYFCEKAFKYYNHFVINERTQNIEYLVEEYFDWQTNSLHTEKQAFIDTKFKHFSNIYSEEYQYDKVFWSNVEIPQVNLKVISDLNSFKDLETQFIDD